MIEIKFIPTGHIFSLPDAEAERIVSEDRDNYEVVKGKLKEPPQPSQSKTVKDLVVVDEEKAALIEKAKALGIGGNLKTMKIETLKEKILEKGANVVGQE